MPKKKLTRGTLSARVSRKRGQPRTSAKLAPAFKAKWVAALRSGKYEQGKGSLREYGKYCCLGVACVIGKVKPIDWSCPFPPPPAMAKWGMEFMDARKLADLNDGTDEIRRHSFAEIADYIEESL